MQKDQIFRFRISGELLDALQERTENVSGYLRALIRADLEENPIAREIPTTPYYYHAKLEEVIDGDTLRLELDVGFEISLRAVVRLAGVNSPEIKTKKGKAVRDYIEKKLKRANIIVETRRREKFGRYLTLVYFHRTYTEFNEILEYGTLLNAELIESGMAERYDL
jgi:endonuclease YncB( thermonuclease family)